MARRGSTKSEGDWSGMTRGCAGSRASWLMLCASVCLQQRITTYEEKTEALNADQQRAVASKPVLQSVVKELEELLVILKVRESHSLQEHS